MAADDAKKKIRVISDLHYEFYKTPEQKEQFWARFGSWADDYPEKVDVLILAGDLCTVLGVFGPNPGYIELLTKIKTDFSHKWSHVVFVAGNHEFYGSYRCYAPVVARLEEIAGETECVFLNRKVCEIDGLKIAGCVLWSNISATAVYMMADFGPNNVFSSQDDYLKEYVKDVKWLQLTCETEHPDVIVTHHLPTSELTHPRFRGKTEINSGFSSDVASKLDLTSVKYAFCGHTHEFMTAKIGETTFVVNPLGYPHEQDTRVSVLSGDVYEVDAKK